MSSAFLPTCPRESTNRSWSPPVSPKNGCLSVTPDDVAPVLHVSVPPDQDLSRHRSSSVAPNDVVVASHGCAPLHEHSGYYPPLRQPCVKYGTRLHSGDPENATI